METTPIDANLALACLDTGRFLDSKMTLDVANSLGMSAEEAAQDILYDAMISFGDAVNGPAILYHRIWPTYLAAPLGAAAAVAAVLGGRAGRTCR